MSGDEVFVAGACAVVVAASTGLTSTAWMPPLALRRTAGLGLVRLAMILAMAWLLLVLMRYADPSVQGIYVAFYLLMGFAAVRGFGILAARFFGVRLRVDVVERANPAAALLAAAMVLGTGMIFGGCLWGEADPTGDDEGGWWIPVGFFLAGWLAWLGALALFFWREPGPTRLRIRRDRRLPEARAAAIYTLVAAWVLTEAVAGDFYGWRHGLVAVGGVTVLLGVRELFTLGQDRLLTSGENGGRGWEGIAYIGSGVAFYFLNRMLEGRLAELA